MGKYEDQSNLNLKYHLNYKGTKLEVSCLQTNTYFSIQLPFKDTHFCHLPTDQRKVNPLKI